MPEPTTAYIGLGSNLGRRKTNILNACNLLAESHHIDLVEVSDLLESSALNSHRQPKYINAVARINTTLPPEQLHQKLTEIEKAIGRTRSTKWSPRTIDLDLLLFGSQIINRPGLTVPHPQMHLRSFVLAGMCRLEPDFLHPVLKKPMRELANRLNGENFFLDSHKPQIISIAGIIGVGKTTLARHLADELHCKQLLEAYDANPFMPALYEGQTQVALDCQLWFLLNRTGQLNPGSLQAKELVLSDYIFEKEFIYARRLLNSPQLALYREIYPHVVRKIAEPVLVIYLTDSPENCLRRIHHRNRPYEQKIEPAFLQDLAADYEKIFTDWKTCPVIRISKKDFDCTRAEHLRNLVEQMKSYIAK